MPVLTEIRPITPGTPNSNVTQATERLPRAAASIETLSSRKGITRSDAAASNLEAVEEASLVSRVTASKSRAHSRTGADNARQVFCQVRVRNSHLPYKGGSIVSAFVLV